MSNNWQEAQLIDQEGSMILTVFDGEEVVSIELMDAHEVGLAESCAARMGFGVAIEAV